MPLGKFCNSLGFALGFQHIYQDFATVNEWKIRYNIPILIIVMLVLLHNGLSQLFVHFRYNTLFIDIIGLNNLKIDLNFLYVVVTI